LQKIYKRLTRALQGAESRLLRLQPQFSLALELREDVAMTGGFITASSRVGVQRGQPAMGRQKSGQHTECGLKSKDGALAMP